MRKLLFLGGANSSVPAILRAKELGYYVITCDYLPDNPGHKFSDQYENISTVNKEKILEVAKKEKIDGIIAYASDPSAPSAAYVCDKLNLSGVSYTIIQQFCEKDLFRQFQKKNGFLTPWFLSIKSMEDVKMMKDQIKFPCVVKPVDASGSKGVKVVKEESSLRGAIEDAFRFSRCGRVIIEEYIASPYFQLHGDGIVANGELCFAALGDQRFRESVPIGSSLPSKIDTAIMEKVLAEVTKLLRVSGFQNGGINIEVRVTEDHNIYIIEIGPRNGGNYVPQLMELATGFDVMTASLKLSMGESFEGSHSNIIQPCFQYIVGSKENGIFQELYIDEYMRKKVVQKYIHKKRGDSVSNYENSNGVVGVVLLKFHDVAEMEKDIEDLEKHIRVIVNEK